MRQKKRKVDRVAVALILCFSVVALASIFTVKSSIDKLNFAQKGNISIGDNAAFEGGQDVVKPVPTVDSKDNTNSDSGASSSSDFQAPIPGNILTIHSMDSPIYSNTLDQYMVHQGVDIEAPANTQVKAIAGGTVTAVRNDDMYGITIEINHGNGLTGIYSNLSTDKMVESGDTVKKGQTISGVGDTALMEILDPTHLHFEMKKDGQTVDPAAYIDFN